jgi:hypothetical protein
LILILFSIQIFIIIILVLRIIWWLKEITQRDMEQIRFLIVQKSFIMILKLYLKFKKIWCASRALVNLPHIANRLTLTSFLFFCDAQPNFWTVRRSLSRNLYGRYPKDSKFQNSEVHQVGPKDYGSQNFSFLAFIGTELVSRQIFPTATARDRRNFFFRSIHVF